MINVSTVIAIIGGIAFLLGLLGGGLEVKEVKIAKLPSWLRIATGMFGIILIGLAVWLSSDQKEIANLLDTSDPTGAAASTPISGSAITPPVTLTENVSAASTTTPIVKTGTLESRLVIGMKARSPLPMDVH